MGLVSCECGAGRDFAPRVMHWSRLRGEPCIPNNTTGTSAAARKLRQVLRRPLCRHHTAFATARLQRAPVDVTKL
jgi:hypothetical protein